MSQFTISDETKKLLNALSWKSLGYVYEGLSNEQYGVLNAVKADGKPYWMLLVDFGRHQAYMNYIADIILSKAGAA